MTGLLDDLADVFDWWLAELWAGLAALMGGARRRRPIPRPSIDLLRDGLRVRGVEGDGVIVSAELLPETLKTLPSRGRGSRGRGKAGAVDLVLPADRCLERRLSPLRLPRRRAEAMAAIDLAASTPLDPASVICLFARDDRGFAGERYFVVRRSELEPAVARLRRAGVAIGRLLIRKGEEAIEIDRRAAGPLLARSWRETLARRLVGGAAAACLVVLAATFGHAAWRLSEASQSLDAQIETASVQAKTIRDQLDERQRQIARVENIRRHKQETRPLVSILEELTRTIPDQAWVSDLSVEDGRVSVNGFAASAAGLIAELEASPFFRSAAFAAPVLKSPGQDGERFAVRMEIEAP